MRQLSDPATIADLRFSRENLDGGYGRVVITGFWQENGFWGRVRYGLSDRFSGHDIACINIGSQGFRYWFETNGLVRIWDDHDFAEDKSTNAIYAAIWREGLFDIQSVLSMGIPDVEPGFTKVTSNTTFSVTRTGNFYYGLITRDKGGAWTGLNLYYDPAMKMGAYEIRYKCEERLRSQGGRYEIERRAVTGRAGARSVRYVVEAFQASAPAVDMRLFDYRNYVPKRARLFYAGHDGNVTMDNTNRQNHPALGDDPHMVFVVRGGFGLALAAWTIAIGLTYHFVLRFAGK